MNSKKIIYEYQNKFGSTLRLVQVQGHRQYPNILPEENILILIEIYDKYRNATASIAYPVEAQEKMWKAVFDVWIKPEKKAKYAEQFRKLIAEELQQAKLWK